VSGLTILAPLRIEARALRSGAPWARVRRVGMGRRRATAALLRESVDAPALIAGFAGGLTPELRAGDIVLASELIGPAGRIALDDPSVLAGVLRRGGLTVHVGPVASSPRIVTGARRAELAAAGALAVDMESAFLAPLVGGRPLTVLRVVLDTAGSEPYRPLRTAIATRVAYRALQRAAGLLEPWARALGPRRVLLASPRASCAGVRRAIETVESALAARSGPLYVRRQIVHNRHVVEALERRGARFVTELDEVPTGSTVVFSAHGVAPSVRAEAGERALSVIDATCPLVGKVHAEARRFAAAGYEIVFVGHLGHEEVEGTLGEAPDRIHVVADVAEAEALELPDSERVAYLTQTTLAVDETAEIVATLRRRFPTIVAPATSDICYATQNRQDGVRSLTLECEAIVVVGSSNSSNSRRLVEVSERAGCPAVLVDGPAELRPEHLTGASTVGVSAGASAPEALVSSVVSAIAGLGGADVHERSVAREDLSFKLPTGAHAPAEG
jgi:4-hydroxy-3-methylbut-2-enyl diphosphate reductase